MDSNCATVNEKTDENYVGGPPENSASGGAVPYVLDQGSEMGEVVLGFPPDDPTSSLEDSKRLEPSFAVTNVKTLEQKIQDLHTAVDKVLRLDKSRSEPYSRAYRDEYRYMLDALQGLSNSFTPAEQQDDPVTQHWNTEGFDLSTPPVTRPGNSASHPSDCIGFQPVDTGVSHRMGYASEDPLFSTGYTEVDRLSMELNKRDKLIQQLSKHLYQLWRANDSLFADYESQETHLTSQLRGLRSRLRDATQTLRQRHSLPRSPSAPPLRTSPIREAVLKFAQDLQTKMAQVDNTILVAEYTELRAAVLDLIVSWDSIDSTEQGRKCERLFLSALHFVELGLAEPARSKPSALTELEARVRQADQQVMYYSTVVEQLRRELQLAKQLSPQMEVTPFVPHESVRVDLSVYEDLDPVSSSTALRAFASCDPPSTPYAEHSSDVSDISSPAVSPTCLDGRSECSVSIVQPITPLEDGVKLDDYQGLTQQEVLVEEFSYGTTAGDKQSSSIDLRQQLGNLLALKESELWRTTANEQIELEIRALRTACSVLSKVHTTRLVGTNLYQLRDAGVQTQDVELQYRTIISSNIIESLEPGDTHLEQVKTDERFDTVVYRPTPDSVERRTDVYRLLEERLIQIVTRLRDLLVAADSTIIHQMGIESVISQWESFVENLHICLRNPGARGLQPLPTSPCITVVDHASAKSINNEEVAQTDGHSVVGSTGVTDAVRKSVSQPAYLYHVETVQHIRENIWQLRAIHGELTGRVNYCMSWMRDHLNFLTSEIGSLAKKLSNTKHKNLRDAAIGTDQPLAPPVIVEASRFPFLDVSSAGRFSSGDRIPVCGDNISDENACAHRATYRDLQFPCERLSTDSVELTSGLHAELLHLRSTQGSLQAQLNAANDEINALTSYLMRIKVELMESLPKNESSAFGTLLDNLEFQAVPQLVSWYIRWATESLGAYSTQLEHRTTSCVHLQNQLDATQYRLNTMEQNYHCVVSEHTETLKQVDDLRRHFQWESDKRSGFQSGMSDRETDRKLFPSHSVASIFDSGLNEVSPIYPGERATLTTPSRSNFNEAIAPEVTLETEPMLQSAQSRVLCSDGGRYVQPVLSHNSPYHPCQIGHRPIFNDDKSLFPELNAGTMNPECDSPHVSDIGSSDESGQLDVQRLMLKLIHNEQCLAENRQELQLVAAAKVELEAQVNKLIGDSHTLQTVKKQLQYSEQQKSDLEYRLQNLQELFSEKSSREAGLSDDLQKARNVIESMSGRISDLSVAKEELEATLIQVVTERDQTKNELKQTRSQLNSALAERDVTWQRLNSVTGELHQQEDLRANLESELVLNREQLLQKENEIALLRIEFASLQTKYQQAQHELEHQTVVLSTHVQTLEVRNTNIDKQVGTDELPTNSWTDLQASEFEYMRQRIKYLEQTNEQMSRELKDGLDKLSLRLEMSDSRDEKLSDIKKLVLCEKEAAFEHRSYIHLETAHVIDCEAEYMKQQLELPGVEDAHISTAACEDISASHAAKRQEYLPPIMDGQSMLSHGQSDHAIITKAEVRRTQSEPTDIKTHLDTKKTRREHANSKWTPVDVHQVCNAWNGYPASVTHDTEAPIDKNSRSVACVTKWMEISTQQQTYSAEADTDVDSLDLAKPTMTSTSADLLPLQISSTVNAISQPIMTSHVIRASPTEYALSPSSLLRTQAELSVELRSRGEQIDVLTRLVRDREAALCDVRYVVSSMEAECSRLGDRVFELSSELDRVNGVNRVLSAKCLEFGIECDGVESRLDVCGFDSDSQIVGVSSGDVQVPLSVSERSIVSSVSSGVQTDPDAVLCRLQRELASVRGEHLQLLSLCDRARSELAAKQFAADCLGVTSVVSVDVGQQTEACLLESVSSVGLGVDQDVFDTVPCDSLAASGAPVLDAIVSVDHSSSFDVIPSGISMCDVDQSVVGVDVVLGDGRSCVSERVVDVDMVGERAAPVVDRVSAGVFDVVDSDVMDAVVSKGIFVESSDLENRLADALCRIDVLEKEKCQLESQLSSVCASSMVDVMNSHVCGLPSVVRSVVAEPLLVACAGAVAVDVDVELLRLRSLHLEWSRVARSVVGVCDTFLGCESRDCGVSDLCPEVLESRCSAVFDLFRTRSEIQCQVENECNLLRERLAASSDFYGAAARELCNIRSVVDGLVVEFELFKSRFSRLLVSINELDELDVGQLRENLLDSLLLNSQDVPRVNDFVPGILPFSCPAETPQFLADGAEGPPGLIPDLKGLDSLFTIHEGHTICERVAMLGKEDVESSVYRSPNDPSKYLSSARLTSTIPAAQSKECSTQAGVKLAVFDRNLWDFKENFAVMKRFVRASLSFSRWACSTLANEIKCHINLSPDHYRSFACELQELLDHLHQLQSTSTLDLTPLDEIEYSGALNLAVENSDKICSHTGSTSWETNLNEPTRKVSTEAATTTGINNDDSSMVADKRLASTKTDVLSTFVYALCLLVNKDECCRIRHLLTEENPSDEFVDVLNGLLHRVELQLTAMSPSHRNSAEDSFPSAEATTSRRPDFSVEKSSCLQKFLNQLNVFLNNPRFSVCDVTAGEFRSYLDNILMKLNLEAPVTVSRTNSDHLIESGEFAVEKSGNIPLSVTDSSMDPIQSLEKEFQTILQSVIRCLSELPRCIENMQVQMGYEYSRPKSCGHTDLVTSLSDNLSRIPEVTELLLIVSVLQEALVQFEGHINEYRQRMRSDLISAQEDMKVLEIETVLERLGQEEVSSRLSEMLSHLLHPSTSAATSASAASPPLELKVVDEQLTRAPSIDSTTAPTHIKVKSACLPSESVNSPASNEAYEKEGNQPLLSGPRETICGSTSEETKDQLVENIHPLISATMNVDASTPTPYDPLEIKHVTSAQRLHRSHSVPVLRDVCFGCVEHSMPEKVYGSTSDVKDCENVYADQSARRLHLLRFLNILEAYFPAFLLHSSNYLHSVLGCFLRPSTIRSGLRFLRHLLLVIPDALLHSEPSELAVQLESQLQRTELHLRRRMTRLRGQLVSIPRQSPDLDARSFRPDLDQINRELEEVTRGYKCVHDLLPVCLPLHPDGPSCSSLLRLASLGTDVYPAFESILPPHIPLLTNESSVLYNNLLKRLLHLRDTEVLYLLMLIGHPLPSTESSIKQKLKKFANWNLVTPIDLHTMPVYRVPVDTIGAYLNTPGAISTTSIITAKPETDHYSTICLPSAVSGPDENNESSNAIVARSSTQLIHCLIQQSREIVENLRTRPDQPCPSSSSVVEGNLYRFEQRLSELIENLQTECLSLRISAQSPGAAHPESAVPSISESSGYPKRAARPPISDLIGAVDQMDELMELRNLAKHLFDQYNIVSSELEHNLDINWCLRQRLNAANEQIDQISKQLYRGHHSLACMEERLSLETEKHAMLTEQCDITRQQTRKTAHILEGLLEKHEHVPSTSADVRFDSVPSLGHSVTAMPRPALKLTHSTEEIRKRQGLLPVMYTRQITHPRLASTPLKHSVSSQTTKQSKFSCLSLNCAPMRRKSPSDLTPTREHERLPSHRRRTIADTKSSTTVARRQTDTSTTFPLSSTSRDNSRFSLQSNNNAVNLSDPSAKPFVTTSHPATMAFDWHKDASYPAEHILTSSDWSDIGTLETALTQSSTVSIPSTSVHTHLESRLSTMPKKPKKRKHLLGRLFTRKRHKKI